MTSNRDRAEWPELFGEPLLASAALDRLTHSAHFVEITGQSFRADPATGTGTFLLGVRTIAATIKADEGEGAVKGAINPRSLGFSQSRRPTRPFASACMGR